MVSDKTTRSIVALVIAGVLLAFLAWLDNVVMANAEQEAAREFRMGGYAFALSVGYLIVAASLLTVAAVARWASSLWVGIPYALVGAFFAFLRAVYFGPAASVNGAPPLLPEGLVRLVSDLYAPTGPLNATAILGAGLVVIGIVVIVAWARGAVSGRQASSRSELTGASAPSPPGHATWR